MQQESPSNSSHNSGNSPLNEAMNSPNSQTEMAGNHEIIFHDYIRLNRDDRDIGDDSPNLWKQHIKKSGNLVVPYERSEVAISMEVVKNFHENRS